MAIKNYLNVGVFATSTLAGYNAMQFTYEYDDDGLYKFVKETKKPQWWWWCFDRGFLNERFYGMMSGICHRKNSYRKEDFNSLKSILKQKNEKKILENLINDEKDYYNNPWLFSGYENDLSYRFSVNYNMISFNVWQKFIKEKPKLFVKKVINNYFFKYFYKGSSFLTAKYYESHIEIFQ